MDSPMSYTRHLMDRQDWQVTRGRVEWKTGSVDLIAEANPPPGQKSRTACAIIGTVQSPFPSGLEGIQKVEVRLDACQHDGDYVNRYHNLLGKPCEKEDPVAGRYLMGFAIVVGTFRSTIGSEPDRTQDRAVQFHFDWWEKLGVDAMLTRTTLPEDEGRTHKFDPASETVKTVQKPCIAWPCFILQGDNYPELRGNPGGHTYGILFSDNARSVSWTLDGQTMGTADLGPYFGSITSKAVIKKIYLTIHCAGSFRKNVWSITECLVSSSEARP